MDRWFRTGLHVVAGGRCPEKANRFKEMNGRAADSESRQKFLIEAGGAACSMRH
jgi:hypothetical protein